MKTATDSADFDERTERADGMLRTGVQHVSLESRVRAEHALRGIKKLLDEALSGMSRAFERVYAQEGRPSNRRNGW